MTSKTTVLAVIVGLILFGLGSMACAAALTLADKDGAAYLLITTAALGGLTAILASTRSTLGNKDIEPTTVSGMVRVSEAAEPQDVNVVNAAADPVPVEAIADQEGTPPPVVGG